MNIFKRKKQRRTEIAPEEIFLDSSNLPEFDVHQFEGRFEKPLRTSTVTIASIFFLVVGLLFMGRLFTLEIAHGATYAELSIENTLHRTPIFADRGVIYDRNGEELAWNEPFTPAREYSERVYTDESGFSDLLGFVSYPKQDQNGNYYEGSEIGKDGLELSLDSMLSGQNGDEIVENNAVGTTTSENVIAPATDGQNVTLSIDADLTHELYEQIVTAAAANNFVGGAGVIIDVRTGKILAMTSYPEYDSNLMTNDLSNPAVAGYFTDPEEPFLDRAVAGLYAPGSIMKPYFAIGGLQEGIVDPNATIDDTGEIEVPNPYVPGQNYVFKDWEAIGVEDMYRALAMSSDVYFYELGGGYDGKPGLGIAGIDAYGELFGFGAPTGIDVPGEVGGTVPSPAWKAANFDGEAWYLGDTYHSAIGQYGWQVTPLQAARGMAAIANGGTLLTPTMLLDASTQGIKLSVASSSFEVVREGMREGVTSGISTDLDFPQVEMASKTGTAQVGLNNEYDNSWDTGFWPYNNPHYAFAIVMEKAPAPVNVGAIVVMQKTMEWMIQNKPQYLQ